MGSLRSPTLGVMGVLGSWNLYQSKAYTWLPNTSQCKLLPYRLPFDRYFNEKVVCTRWYGVFGELGVGSCADRKLTTDFTIPLNTKFSSICLRLAWIPTSNYGPNLTPSLGVIVGLWCWKWYQSKCRLHIRIRLLYTGYTHHILHRLATTHNAADIHSDRNKPPCCSIGGLINCQVFYRSTS